MKKERIFWGVLFILIGMFLIINKLGYFPNINVFSLLLTVFLLAVIVKSLPHFNFAGILLPIAFICIIYDKELGITNITPWTVLIAAILSSIGLSIIFHKGMKGVNTKYNWKDYKFEKIDVEDESNVRFKNSFCDSVKYINTNNFEQADFNCSFGAMKVYFDNAIMSNSNAIVRIDASFSGIELYIPKTWNIDNKINVFLGDISEKNRNNQITTNTLTLVGDIKFSGVEIIYI
ncbi:LiaF transmembrane domain-containing protein [Clostridium gasigenes]|uniref:Predicted membrane protein n=1 Tax=Clostridium gasigenes TaxID=94869 RepID=A0A1H0QA06_9CLOT|nr:LiaF domain-containing protein [Clostridium gasigenes]SDP14154.1 Predicted membrane protein [Clostridium gasigenes]